MPPKHPSRVPVTAAVCLGLAFAMARGACRVPLERALTLGQPDPHPLELAHGRMAEGTIPMRFVFPYADTGDCLPHPLPHLAWADSAGGSELGFLALAGEEFRPQEGGPWTTEAGGLFGGRRGPASFALDTRIYTEVGGRRSRPSFDGEDVDEQKRDASGSLDYRSYARFRGDMTLDLPFGTVSAARDAAHWGPGLYGNLMLNQSALPFFQYVFSTRIGPLRVTSLYGDLSIGPSPAFSVEDSVPRSLYAHRYELSLGDAVEIGISEEVILYGLSKPYLFIPVFPLFAAKSMLNEDRNNGSLAADAAWRSPFSALFYAEFLLDDMESPSSLLTKDYLQNKWGALAGIHWSRESGGKRWGAIVEFSRVEPWVYAHFVPSTAQAANAGRPLGNPQGADSRTLIVKAYARAGDGWYAALMGGLYWKGKGPGGDLNAPVPETPLAPKESLAGEGSPDWVAEPELSWTGRRMQAYLFGKIGTDPGARAGVRAFY